MELTQIKGDAIGTKMQIGEGINKINSDKNLVSGGSQGNSGHFAEIAQNEEGVAKISATDENNHLKINGQKIPVNQAKEINEGDSVSFGENHENVFAVHGENEKIGKNEAKKHFEKAGHQVSDEEFSEIIRRLDVEEKLIKNMFVGLLIVSLFFTGAVFFLNSQNNYLSEKVFNLLNNGGNHSEELKKLIGKSSKLENGEACDEELDEGCAENLTLFEKIEKLEEKFEKSGEEGEKALLERISLLEDRIARNEESGTKLEFDDETKGELSKIISGVVEEINSFKTDDNKGGEFDNSENLEKIATLEKTIEELKENISGEELDFGKNGEKVGKAVKILLGKIMRMQAEIKKLK